MRLDRKPLSNDLTEIFAERSGEKRVGSDGKIKAARLLISKPLTWLAFNRARSVELSAAIELFVSKVKGDFGTDRSLA
ncbi:hypothetical protein, partial [Bradyrhizobium sp. SZCCHNRI20481]|uniref:hypothetical protein n=1 Tax=Bradyrhizobium sp. SZCCHNRI20481 TaxID=3057286 RepID=UPI002915FE7A